METMKRAAITGVRQAVLLDTPIPEPKEDWVLVKVHAVPLCTEYKNWLTGTEYGGHEAAGEVVKVAQPGKVKVGALNLLPSICVACYLVALLKVVARIGVGAVSLALHHGQRIVTDGSLGTLHQLGRVLFRGRVGRDDRFLRTLPLGA